MSNYRLKPIDTTTTNGKIEVMRLAEAGHKVVYCHREANVRGREYDNYFTSTCPTWQWGAFDYAIVEELKEYWVVLNTSLEQIAEIFSTEKQANEFLDTRKSYSTYIVVHVREVI